MWFREFCPQIYGFGFDVYVRCVFLTVVVIDVSDKVEIITNTFNMEVAKFDTRLMKIVVSGDDVRAVSISYGYNYHSKNPTNPASPFPEDLPN